MSNYEIFRLNEIIDLQKAVEIKQNGASYFSATQDFANKISKFFLKSNNEMSLARRANAYVEQETKDELLDKKIEQSYVKEEKIMDKFVETQTNEAGRNNKDYWLDKYSDTIIKHRQKRITYQKQGLNAFSLPELVFMQFKKNCKRDIEYTIQSGIDKVEEVKNNLEEKLEKKKEDAVNKAKETERSSIKASILKLFADKIAISNKLEEQRRNNPDIYNEVIDELTSNREDSFERPMSDDDLIYEVGQRHSSR